MAAIGTLLFTGVATYYDAMVSRDQLSQSRKDDEQKRREQASRVATWVDRASGGGLQLHLTNPTADPVTSIYLGVRAGDTVAVHKSFDLGPCSDMVYDANGEYVLDNHLFKREKPSRIEAFFLSYKDHSGKRWFWRNGLYDAHSANLAKTVLETLGKQPAFRFAHSHPERAASCVDSAK